MNEVNPNTPPPKKRKKLLILISLIFLVLLLLVLVYWIFFGQFREYTNDAYVGGNRVELTSQISGSVVSIYADDTDYVKAGQLLLELDPTEAIIRLESAKAKLAQSLRDVVKLFETVKELEAQAEIDQAELIKTTQDYEHRENLVESGGVSVEDFEHAEAALKTAFNALLVTHHRLKAAIAQIDHTTVITHPLVEEGKNTLRDAWVNLKRCKIYAPVSGIVSQRKIQVGEWINPTQPLLAIVPLDQIWADVNYKEVQLKHLRIGQPATIHADIYGSHVTYHGKVAGLTGGTGAVFSVLPPQNATGNWIKIVQRLTVRVHFDLDEIQKNPLLLGLSLEVTTNTHDRSGLRLSSVSIEKPQFETDIFDRQLEGVDLFIEEIIKNNVDPVYLSEQRFMGSSDE